MPIFRINQMVRKNASGQIIYYCIIPRPEFRGFGGLIPLLTKPFGVTSAEVAINCSHE